MIVSDTSALVETLLRTPTAATIQKRLFASGEIVYVPHLIDIEMAQVLRRYVRRGEFDAEQGRAMLQTFAGLPLLRYSHQRLLPRVWELRDNLTAYDASYVALAELLDAPLVTRDRRLAGAPGLRARIELV